tara:strand:- start:385 stop:660 length:276 start_codon:yes stop_codon:yes gene_type:complete
LKINNSRAKGVARWESIKCCCGKDFTDSYPIKDCLHCKFDQCWQSVPQENYKVNDDQHAKDGKITKKQTRTIKEITLVRGTRYEDVIGWLA